MTHLTHTSRQFYGNVSITSSAVDIHQANQQQPQTSVFVARFALNSLFPDGHTRS